MGVVTTETNQFAFRYLIAAVELPGVGGRGRGTGRRYYFTAKLLPHV